MENELRSKEDEIFYSKQFFNPEFEVFYRFLIITAVKF